MTSCIVMEWLPKDMSALGLLDSVMSQGTSVIRNPPGHSMFAARRGWGIGRVSGHGLLKPNIAVQGRDESPWGVPSLVLCHFALGLKVFNAK